MAKLTKDELLSLHFALRDSFENFDRAWLLHGHGLVGEADYYERKAREHFAKAGRLLSASEQEEAA